MRATKPGGTECRGLSGIAVELCFEEEPTPCNTLRTAGEGGRVMDLPNSNGFRFRFPRRVGYEEQDNKKRGSFSEWRYGGTTVWPIGQMGGDRLLYLECISSNHLMAFYDNGWRSG